MKKKAKKKTKNKPQSTARTSTPPRETAVPETRNQAFSDYETDTGDQCYDLHLHSLLNPWKVLASENRKRDGLKSLTELLRGTEDDATRIAIGGIKSTAVALGIRLSKLIVEYILVYWRYDMKEISMKIRVVTNTIRLERLEEEGEITGSVSGSIIEKLLSVIELVDREFKYPVHYNDREYFEDDQDEEEDHTVWVSERENRILKLFFYRVLFLEILLCFPEFKEGLKSEGFEKIGEIVAGPESGFEEGMRSLRAEIDALKREERENERSLDELPENLAVLESNRIVEVGVEDLKAVRIKNSIGSKIEEIWNQSSELVTNNI